MTIYFSPSTRGLYPDGERYGDALPNDAVAITEALYLELINGQCAGKVITPDGEKPPYLSDAVIDHVAEAEATRDNLRSAADKAIAPLQDASDLGIATEEEKTALTAWKTYRVNLMRVDTSTTPVTFPALPVSAG